MSSPIYCSDYLRKVYHTTVNKSILFQPVGGIIFSGIHSRCFPAFLAVWAGILIGKGYTTKEAMDEVQMVVEGVYAAKAAKKLAEKYNVEMPIVEQVNQVLFDGKSPADGVKDLMLRDKKIEAGNVEWH